MKRVYVIAFLILTGNVVLCQNKDTIALPKYRLVKCGYIFVPKDTKTSSYVNPIEGVWIYTYDPDSDSLFSISSGQVIAVERIENKFVCVIKASNAVFTYSNLKSTPLKKGMFIKNGNYIGQMGIDDNTKQVRLVISQKNKALNFNRHLSYILQK